MPQCEGWESSLVKCDLCGHTWVAVRPAGTAMLECPNCHNIAYFENISA
jgi:ribosomal protein S27E